MLVRPLLVQRFVVMVHDPTCLRVCVGPFRSEFHLPPMLLDVRNAFRSLASFSTRSSMASIKERPLTVYFMWRIDFGRSGAIGSSFKATAVAARPSPAAG